LDLINSASYTSHPLPPAAFCPPQPFYFRFRADSQPASNRLDLVIIKQAGAQYKPSFSERPPAQFSTHHNDHSLVGPLPKGVNFGDYKSPIFHQLPFFLLHTTPPTYFGLDLICLSIVLVFTQIRPSNSPIHSFQLLIQRILCI
jgi:hypothetical protein